MNFITHEKKKSRNAFYLDGIYASVDFKSEKWKEMNGLVFRKILDADFDKVSQCFRDYNSTLRQYGVDKWHSRWAIFLIINSCKDKSINLVENMVKFVV